MVVGKKDLSIPFIKGYRSMLSAVFKFKLPSIGQDPILKDLLRSFAVQRPGTSHSCPSWVLNKVLSFLSSSEFEPLEGKDLRILTMKVLFLVSLASARRIGELQALFCLVPSKGEDLVLITYASFFVAKSETVTNPISRSFLLKSLGNFAGI